MKLLDERGLTTVWAAIKNTFISKSDADGKYAKKSEAATHTSAGVMTPSDKIKLDGIAENANNYSLPLAATSTRGGIQLGYNQNGRNYPVQLSGEKAYVNVPWTDTNTTYDLSSYSQKDETVKNIYNNMLGTSGSCYKQILKIDYANGTTKNIEISNARGGLDGFMSASDKNKLDNIADRANNYTLPTALDTTLGGIKTGYNPRSGNYFFKVNVDVNGNANTYIPGLVYGNEDHLNQVQILTDSEEYVSLHGDKIYFHDQKGVETDELLLPKKSGTFALTSDLSDLCKFNFINSISECRSDRINFLFRCPDTIIDISPFDSYPDGTILLITTQDDARINHQSGMWYTRGNSVDETYQYYTYNTGINLITKNNGTVHHYNF